MLRKESRRSRDRMTQCAAGFRDNAVSVFLSLLHEQLHFIGSNMDGLESLS